MIAAGIFLQHAALALCLVDIPNSVCDMVETEVIALMRDLDLDFFGLVAGVGAREAVAGCGDCFGGFVLGPRFTARKTAGVDPCG